VLWETKQFSFETLEFVFAGATVSVNLLVRYKGHIAMREIIANFRFLNLDKYFVTSCVADKSLL
jgi:hypothetical protein